MSARLKKNMSPRSDMGSSMHENSAGAEMNKLNFIPGGALKSGVKLND